MQKMSKTHAKNESLMDLRRVDHPSRVTIMKLTSHRSVATHDCCTCCCCCLQVCIGAGRRIV